MTYTLLTDVLSNKNKTVYGKKGEVVTLIADHDNVLIVKGNSGLLPVEVKKLKECLSKGK